MFIVPVHPAVAPIANAEALTVPFTCNFSPVSVVVPIRKFPTDVILIFSIPPPSLKYSVPDAD